MLCYRVSLLLSKGCPRVKGRLHTRYSPVCRSSASIATPVTARLACVRPAASVYPEPGSNSPLYNFFFSGVLLHVVFSRSWTNFSALRLVLAVQYFQCPFALFFQFPSVFDVRRSVFFRAAKLGRFSLSSKLFLFSLC